MIEPKQPCRDGKYVYCNPDRQLQIFLCRDVKKDTGQRNAWTKAEQTGNADESGKINVV